ncbi:hypothetical protein OG948_56485 (plasmid) [Embleya sp. NBC_00888]|uniref:hypothetical protein n=1 Tax=Embleya sp. NBC_00888 TaxID=2975960 RepID=UPI00386CCA80|nr:hypothetical protein OG948_56485 [Embleya sp. NBC_00888]
MTLAARSTGRGVATTLLKRAWQIYRQLGWSLVYGSHEADRNLGTPYAHCGWTDQPGAGNSPSNAACCPGSEPGVECLFSRRRPRP